MIFTARKFLPLTLIVFIVYVLSSCTSEKVLFFNSVKVKNYPTDTPFVYNNIINIKGSISKDEKTRLQESLVGYWADSLYARRVEKFGVFYTLKNPPVFDTTTISTTRRFMNSYLFSQGYFNALLTDTFHIDTFHKDNKPVQYRTTVIMNINPQKRVVIDSLAYNLNDTTLERITKQFSNESLINPGKTPYSKEILTAELDRLVALYRQRGYYLLQRDDLAAVVDTVNTALLKLTLDPFEQAKLIEQAANKNKTPTASVNIQQRRFADTTVDFSDTAFLQKFSVNTINYFPETQITDLPDSILNHKEKFKVFSNRGYNVFYNRNTFNPNIFRHYNYMRTNRLYNDLFFYKTINTYNQIGAWRQVDTRINIHGDSIDINYFLYPERKQNITYNLEASRNTGDILSSNNFFGLALNITYKNRNVFRQAVQSTTSFTNGVELSFGKQQTNNSLLQAFQISLGQTYSVPRLLVPFKVLRLGRLDFGRTIISANASYSDRQDFFRVRSLVADFGYDWKYKNKIWQVRFPNVELYSLDTLPQLAAAFKSNPFLRNSFNTGYVISAQGTLSITYSNKRNVTNYANFSVEESGLPGLNNKNSRIYQYIKVAAEARKRITFSKTEVAFRAFAGVGYNYNSSGRFGVTLPFFKQFIAGGPNSMRAWALRQLGLGSSLLSDTSSTFRDRYGDMQLEANAEYRYQIAHFTSVNVNGALFADAGNIWNIRKDTNNPESEFNINKLGHDIAIGVGTGLRFDFHYFLIRIDGGIKLKDPARIANNGWLDIANFTWRNHEYEKFDADGKRISPNRNNYAIQLGIGLPF